MTHARQQIATKECTSAKEGKQVDVSKTNPGHVEKARCVVGEKNCLLGTKPKGSTLVLLRE